jgi:23S rRNA (guanosine2251-2'-O)-methyltransferase
MPVLECLRAGHRAGRTLYVLDGARGLESILAVANIPIKRLSRNELDTLSGGVQHQGVVLDADPLPIHKADTWIAREFPTDALVVVLDGVEDPHNFGAIVRSAVACGASGVLFGKDRAAPVSTAAMKAAAGAMEHIDLVRATNLVRALDALKEAGFWIAGLDGEAPQTIWDADLKGRTVLVIGGEGKGLRRLVREHCDYLLCIPLPGPITTLNASVSAAVALAECVRQRT